MCVVAVHDMVDIGYKLDKACLRPCAQGVSMDRLFLLPQQFAPLVCACHCRINIISQYNNDADVCLSQRIRINSLAVKQKILFINNPAVPWRRLIVNHNVNVTVNTLFFMLQRNLVRYK